MSATNNNPTFGCSKRTERRRRQLEINSILNKIRVNSSLNNSSDLPETVNDTIPVNSLVEPNTARSLDASTTECNIIKKSREDESESCIPKVRGSFEDSLRCWALFHNITHVAVRDLLGIIKTYNPQYQLPIDPRTFMKTPKCIKLSKFSGGEFYYANWIDIVKSRMNQVRLHSLPEVVLRTIEGSHDQNSLNLITLTIGVDGIPISKSSNSQFWPILGVVDQSQCRKPFVIGMYYGQKKPKDLNFLNEFVEDCLELEQNGIFHKEKQYVFRISKVLADSPARCFLKSVKSHNSYFGCERCNQEGEWLGRVVFTEKCGTLRTDELFRSRTHKEHHTGNSILEKLKIGLVSQFPLDYLHLVCLGSTRKLLFQWVKGRPPYKLRHAKVDQISAKLVSFKLFFPSDFPRKPRTLNDINYYKGTELRTFLLYTGYAALYSVLDKDELKNFLFLHTAMYILLSKHCSETWWNSLAQKLLEKFVKNCVKLYGHEFISYNIHSLLHLSDDAKTHNSIEECSTFKFESYMQPSLKSDSS